MMNKIDYMEISSPHLSSSEAHEWALDYKQQIHDWAATHNVEVEMLSTQIWHRSDDMREASLLIKFTRDKYFTMFALSITNSETCTISYRYLDGIYNETKCPCPL